MDLTDDDAKQFLYLLCTTLSLIAGLLLMGAAVTSNQEIIKAMKDQQDVKKIDEIGWTWYYVGIPFIVFGMVGMFFTFGFVRNTINKLETENILLTGQLRKQSEISQ